MSRTSQTLVPPGHRCVCLPPRVQQARVSAGQLRTCLVTMHKVAINFHWCSSGSSAARRVLLHCVPAPGNTAPVIASQPIHTWCCSLLRIHSCCHHGLGKLMLGRLAHDHYAPLVSCAAQLLTLTPHERPPSPVPEARATGTQPGVGD